MSGHGLWAKGLKDHDAPSRPRPQLLAESAGCLPRMRWGSIRSTPIEPETRFFADLGLASIDAVVLGEAIQGHFGRPVPFAS